MTFLLDTCLISEVIAKHPNQIAIHHSLSLVTRNEKDFAGTGVLMINLHLTCAKVTL
jgi:predicted nucleic acid-binding protein